MSVKMPFAFRKRKRIGFSHVVQQHTPSFGGVFPRIPDRPRYVSVDVVTMPRRTLPKSVARREFGYYRKHNSAEFQKRAHRVIALQKFIDFFKNSFGGYGIQPALLTIGSDGSASVGGKAERRTESDQPEYSERVFVETPVRVSDATQYFVLYVPFSAEGVYQPVGVVICHRIYREVSAA